MPGNATFFSYVKAAFLYHWNLLFLAAGVAGAFIVSLEDVLLPLIGAAEILYLALLSSNQRFQKNVDALFADPSPEQRNEKTAAMIEYLSNADRDRFAKLKSRCIRLRSISVDNGLEMEPPPEGIVRMQLDGINRMLWIFLKLLYSKNALEHYFNTVDRNDIDRKIKDVEQRLDSMGKAETDSMDESKKRQSLQDTLETSKSRLKTYGKAKKNYDFINLELERLHAKITSLAEMGVNRQNPEAILNEIDQASTSVEQMEAIMPELEFFSDISFQEMEPPDLLKA